MKKTIFFSMLSFLLIICSPTTHAVEMTYTYDDAGRLTGISYPGGSSIAYVYDDAGNITNISQNVFADGDNDGVPDISDNCPSHANLDQSDKDGDSIGDVCDECSDDPNKTASGICGCGVADTDTDNDTIADCWEIDHFGDLSKDGTVDSDNDGLIDLGEYQKNTEPLTPDTDGDSLPDGWEDLYGLDPLDATGINGKDGDFDNDGISNYKEYNNGTKPNDETSPGPTPPEIIETIPHNGAGIADDLRIPENTSFAVFLKDEQGIDITDTNSVVFTIDDGINAVYTRDLSDNDVVKVLKLTNDADTEVTALWVTYARSVETNYPYSSDINIKVDAKDRVGALMEQASFDFRIESEEAHNQAEANLPDVVPIDLGDSNFGGVYDQGVELTTGDLKGCKIIYSGTESVIPTIGPLNEVPPLNVSGIDAVGVPLNLQPPTVFTNPVIIFVPCPGYADVSDLNIYMYNGIQWVLACDAEGNVQPDGEGWVVPDSRVNHNENDPAAIEIQVYHFTGVQGGSPSSKETPTSEETSDLSSDPHNGLCFISAAVYGSTSEPQVAILREFRDRFLLSNTVGRAFVKFYYVHSPAPADFIARSDGLRVVVRAALLPLVGVSCVMLRLGTFWSLIAMAGIMLLVLGLYRKVPGRREQR
ncbi:CFI-box-CTERM domain-containing protein [Thermodesulfobacteriota bacterium]